MTATYTRVVLLGDSLAWGSVASTPNTAWPWLVLTSLNARNSANAHFWLVDGVPGITTAGAIIDLQEMAFVPVADLYVVELGTNDYNQLTPLPSFDGQYNALMAMLHNANPAATIVGLTCWDDATAAAAYNAVIVNEVPRSNAPQTAVVPLGPLFATAGYHQTTGDTYHPNDAGHAAIANAIVAALA